jgi:hypothetical protein
MWSGGERGRRTTMQQMTESKGYNGWTNYATWGVALVLDNDEGTYSRVREILGEIKTDAPRDATGSIWGEDAAYVRGTFTDALKGYVEELCYPDEGGDDLNLMQRQVMQAGLAEVNWREIADNIIGGS